eukprot:GSChrysophyteH2.ASY1.ANO1.333.1 assembled CDS
MKDSKGAVQKVDKRPKPKWFVLQSLNYVVLAVFVGSATYAGLNYPKLVAEASTRGSSGSSESPLTSFLFPFMILWTLCLAYFFGFFGISLVDTEALGESPSSFGLAELQKEADTRAEAANKAKHSVPRTIPTSAPAAAEGEEEPDYASMSDEDVLESLLSGQMKDYQLEKKLGDYERAVFLRRMLYENILDRKLDLIPFAGYDYNRVFGANCEIVIGYVPIPVGVVGPLIINSEPIYIPMATTEGCLVASTNRGCKAISASGGCNSILLKDAITRAPSAFNGTTNFGKLQSADVTCAGRNAYLRFCCMSGDAMGMNMVSKGCLAAIEVLEEVFPDMVLVAISGNMCTDKKPSAINWILGRGKSVIVEAVIPDRIVKTVLKSSVHDMIETNKQKNHIGSAMAGSIGGFNAHAANIVTAVFLATGCLEIAGVRGAAKCEGSSPGDNARKLAMIVGAATLAGELSLIAALAANHLVRSHMQHNRKPTTGEAPAVAAMKKNASMPELQNRK